MAESPRTPVPVALIGLGKMGRFHYKTIRGDPRFELLAVVDPQVAELPEGDAGPELLSNVSGLRQRFPQLAAAVVAAPTSLHYDLTRQLLEQDIAVLVEKPAATNGAAARELVDLAERRGVPLAAGHVERCNPAVSALQTVLGCGILGRPVHVHAMRGGPWPPGASHNHVILDLAVHELDVLALLLGPLELEHGALHTLADTPDRPHTAEIQVKSPAGVTASVHANWLTPQKTRQMRVTGTGGVGIIDYAAQTCHLWGKDLREKESLLRLPFRRGEEAGPAHSLEVEITPRHSLEIQLEHFLHLLDGRPHRLCSGDAMVQAVSLVDEIMGLTTAPVRADASRPLEPQI